MKKTIALAALCLVCIAGTAQNTWTWMHGSSTSTNLNPTYGTQGVGSTANSPGHRESPVMWSDASGNIWLFGGYCGGYRNDLWKFTPSNGQWTWVGGSSSTYAYGTYGTQGSASSSNWPGCKYYASGAADASGNLWLFGGYGYSQSVSYTYMNDLWKYNISSGQWTWVKGSNSGTAYGTYGTQGTAGSSNTPGTRYAASMAFDASSGCLFIFGGEGYSSNSSGNLGDLWKFDPSTSNYTWMKGPNTNYQYGTYGSQGSASSSNYPGTRYSQVLTSDNSGNIWLFGGVGYGAGSSGYLNDLWKYNVSSGNWTWMSGSNAPNQSGTYGSQGTASSSNVPGARYFFGSSAISDNSGNFWVFGGYGYPNSASNGYLNDTWQYNVTSGQWTWHRGSNTTYAYGVYGTQGVTSVNNTPGARYHAAGTKDPSGNMWIYGGYGYNSSNNGDLEDLWKLELCNPPNTPTNTTASSNLYICSGASTTLSALTNTGTIVWYASSTSTTALGTGTNYVPTGNTSIGTSSVYTYFAQGSLACGVSLQRTAVSLTVNPTPTLVVNHGTICAGAQFALLPAGANSYSYSGGSNVVSPQTSTSYTITGYSAAGCVNTVAAVSNVSVNPAPSLSVNSGTICPGGSFTIIPSGAATYSINNGSLVVSPPASTFYIVSGTSSLGCISHTPAISNVIVNASPTITAASGSICAGNNFVIMPSGAVSYTITGGSATVSPAANSTYSITGTSPEGCISPAAAIVTVSVVSRPSISAPSGSICGGQSFVLSPTGAASYTYSGGSATVTPAGTSTYAVTGSNAQGCPSASAAIVTISVTPLPVVIAPGSSICPGASFTISPSGATSYSYMNGGPVVSPASTTVYSVTGTTNGCSGSATGVTIAVLNSPTVSVTGGSVCAGQTFSIQPSGAATYVYSEGAVVSPTATTNYTVTGTSGEGCTSGPAVLTVSVAPAPALNPVSSASVICIGEDAVITVGAAISYTWSNSLSTQSVVSSSSSLVVNPSIHTTYMIKGVNAEGCVSSAMITQNVQACTGIAAQSAGVVEIYPNPTDGIITISLIQVGVVSIFNGLGQEVMQAQEVSGTQQIDLSGAANGVYLVRIETNGTVMNHRIIKH